MRKLLFVILSLWVLPGQAQIQPPDSLRHHAISFHPLYIFNSGTRFDFDWRLKQPNHWVIFGPQFYTYNSGSEASPLIGDYSFEQLIGGGLNLQYRYYLLQQAAPYGSYLGAEIPFMWVQAEYKDEFGDESKQSVAKTGISILIGHQSTAYNFLLLDTYMGLGYRHSRIQTDGPEYNMGKSKIAFGYTGVLLVVGFRIGGWL